MRLGWRLGPTPGCLDTDLLRRYADATRDPSPRARTGEAVPTSALVTLIWDAQNEARRQLVDQSLFKGATGVVHGEHQIVLHRAVEPDEPLQIWAEGHGARTAGRNALVTLRYSALDPSGAVVADQWWTTVLVGVSCAPVGESPPDHAFPDLARRHPLGAYAVAVDEEMAHRYAAVTGDWSAHHFDGEAARRSGFDRPFLHGLCTMALCGQAITEIVASGDPTRVRRLAVRFAAPTYLGERLEVNLYDAGGLGVAFEAHAGTVAVITHGRAELW